MIGAGGIFWFLTQSQKIKPNIPSLPNPTVNTTQTSPTVFPPQVQTGFIEGSMSFPSEGIPPGVIVCAEEITTKVELCTTERINDTKYTYRIGYKLEVLPGKYLVYEKLPPDEYRAYYSEFVTCGLRFDCTSHNPIEVEVKADETVSNIDPQDWYNQPTPTF